MLLHPLHAFLLLREHLRYRINKHQIVVNFSELGEDELRRFHRVRTAGTAVIPNGVDLGRFRRDPTARSCRRALLGLAPEQTMVIFVGHEFARKGLDIAIDAMRHVDPSVSLYVVGGTPHMIERARASASDLGSRIQFLGQRTTDLPEIYAAADIFVLPSAQEAWPLALLEAMACGLACIATPVSSIPEFVVDDVNGVLAERTASAFASAITGLTDARTRARVGESAAQTAAGFGWDRVASMYLEVVRSCA
ncbi:MAG TPA: glycosyltransferase family 4 protein [Acidothermaceae bacterium]|nr:glycosyltransferase family 4 protein [Acidothermaceae bacterium]